MTIRDSKDYDGVLSQSSYYTTIKGWGVLPENLSESQKVTNFTYMFQPCVVYIGFRV